MAAKRLALILVLIASAAAQHQPPIRCPEGPSIVNFQAGQYRTTAGITLHFRDFVGRMVPRGSSIPACLVKTTHVERGRVLIRTDELTQAFNQKLAGKSSIRDLKLTTEGERLKISGTAQKAIPIPFEISGPLQTTQAGKVQMKAESIEGMQLPIGELLDLFGTELEDLFGGSQSAGVRVRADTVLFDPEILMEMKGRVTRANVVPNGVLLVFGRSNPKPVQAAEPARTRSARPAMRREAAAPQGPGENELPTTASGLPLLGLAGLFCVAAAALRFRRA